MFRPYKKLAKLSLNRLRLSWRSCRCMKLVSKSAIESLSSANCGSSESSALARGVMLLCEFRKEDRDEGLRGVVGRDTGDRDLGLTDVRV